MKRLLICLMILLLSQASHAQENESLTAEADSSGYITASLMIVQPDRGSLITYYGHSALRLQCPSAGLDYCFSFDSYTSGSFWALVTGADRTTLLPISTPDFIQRYTSQHRNIYEHELNLTLAEERRLWQMVDRLVEMKDYLQTDFLNHGCAGETASIIVSSLDGQLQYPATISSIEDSHYEIINTYMGTDSWEKLMLSIFSAQDARRHLADNEEKLMLPSQLERVWQETHIIDPDGSVRPIFAQKPMKEYEAEGVAEPDSPLLAPTSVMLPLLVLVIVLCVAELFYGRIRLLSTGIDVLLMLIQTGIGMVLLGLLLCSTLPTTSGWNWNSLVFNPLPCLIWLACLRRHREPKMRCMIFALYTVVAVGFALYMCLAPTYFLMPQYFLVSALAIRCAFLSLQAHRQRTAAKQ